MLVMVLLFHFFLPNGWGIRYVACPSLTFITTCKFLIGHRSHCLLTFSVRLKKYQGSLSFRQVTKEGTWTSLPTVAAPTWAETGRLGRKPEVARRSQPIAPTTHISWSQKSDHVWTRRYPSVRKKQWRTPSLYRIFIQAKWEIAFLRQPSPWTRRISVTGTQTLLQCSHGEQTWIQEKQQEEFLGFLIFYLESTIVGGGRSLCSCQALWELDKTFTVLF